MDVVRKKDMVNQKDNSIIAFGSQAFIFKTIKQLQV
jgi:hypothetical protein